MDTNLENEFKSAQSKSKQDKHSNALDPLRQTDFVIRLKEELQPHLLRRLKRQVLGQLPSKVYLSFSFPLSLFYFLFSSFLFSPLLFSLSL